LSSYQRGLVPATTFFFSCPGDCSAAECRQFSFSGEDGIIPLTKSIGRIVFCVERKVRKGDEIVIFTENPTGGNGLEYYGPGYVPGGLCKIHVKPHIIGDLNGPEDSFKAVHGVVSAGWKKAGRSLRLEVSILVNCKAKLSVPNMGLKNGMITEHSWIIWWCHAKYN